MSLTYYTTAEEWKTKTKNYVKADIFPSLNVSYDFNSKQLVRMAYGMSTNRPEFREVSPASYYDFDLFNRIMGNPDLKCAYIQNVDLRYEFYPTPSELVSVALFYKHFRNPIEWTFIYTGGGARDYTFENADAANNYGLEVDIKKSLDFIGMKNFSLVLNGSLIDSKVNFAENSMEYDRPMQGQSPYIVNTGLFYQHEKLQLNAGILYNVIGKRIVGIGMTDRSETPTIDNEVPDMYEMPRNVVDFNCSKKFGKKLEIALSIRDLLAQEIVFKQYPQFHDDQGNLQTREQVTKRFKPGQNISLTAKLNF